MRKFLARQSNFVIVFTVFALAFAWNLAHGAAPAPSHPLPFLEGPANPIALGPTMPPPVGEDLRIALGPTMPPPVGEDLRIALGPTMPPPVGEDFRLS